MCKQSRAADSLQNDSQKAKAQSSASLHPFPTEKAVRALLTGAKLLLAEARFCKLSFEAYLSFKLAH